ncbi:aminotransferase class V-fold PLP-dependent enzyme [Virgibacillus kimchii]
MIYFDQAASSFPKPPEVTEAMYKTIKETGANPGRGSHRLAREAAKVIHQAREKAATLFGCTDPKKAVFFQNATMALNQAIKGLNWHAGDHIITTTFEHNSIHRPLVYLEKYYGVHVTYIDWHEDENQVTDQVKRAINDRTRLLAITHASNVTGAVFPLGDLMNTVKEQDIITLVDASQTAGHIDIHMKDQLIDMLVFPGHKGLLGPQGTGMLLMEGEVPLTPIHHGGTGSFSQLADQPERWPEFMESGTLNTPGISGLLAALKVFEAGKDENVPRETLLVNKLLKGLNAIPNVQVYGPGPSSDRLPIAAFNIDQIDSQEVATILDSHYDIAVRAGLHCSPLTHEILNTENQGVIRASLNYYNTNEEVDIFLRAIEEIAAAYQEF